MRVGWPGGISPPGSHRSRYVELHVTGSGGRPGETDRWKHRHRAHGRPHKDSGFGRFPSRMFAINTAWLELALTGIDLLAWTQMLLLDGELAVAEPK